MKTLVEQRRIEANNMKVSLQVDSLLDQSKYLETLWRIELANNGVGAKSLRLQAEYKRFNKEHFPVILSLVSGVDYFTKQPYSYGEIDFSKAGCGWTDSSIFHDVHAITHRYVPNKIGNMVNIKYSSGGGSAFYEFEYNQTNLNIISKALQGAGYKVLITD